MMAVSIRMMISITVLSNISDKIAVFLFYIWKDLTDVCKHVQNTNSMKMYFQFQISKHCQNMFLKWRY